MITTRLEHLYFNIEQLIMKISCTMTNRSEQPLQIYFENENKY